MISLMESNYELLDGVYIIINGNIHAVLKTCTEETPLEHSNATVEEITQKAMVEHLERVRTWNAWQKEMREELERIIETEKAIQKGKAYELAHPLPVDAMELAESLDEKLARYKAETNEESQKYNKAVNRIGEGIESAYKKYKDIYDHDGFEDK